jgi:hypothetical protein
MILFRQCRVQNQHFFSYTAIIVRWSNVIGILLLIFMRLRVFPVFFVFEQQFWGTIQRRGNFFQSPESASFYGGGAAYAVDCMAGNSGHFHQFVNGNAFFLHYAF